MPFFFFPPKMDVTSWLPDESMTIWEAVREREGRRVVSQAPVKNFWLWFLLQVVPPHAFQMWLVQTHRRIWRSGHTWALAMPSCLCKKPLDGRRCYLARPCSRPWQQGMSGKGAHGLRSALHTHSEKIVLMREQFWFRSTKSFLKS